MISLSLILSLTWPEMRCLFLCDPSHDRDTRQSDPGIRDWTSDVLLLQSTKDRTKHGTALTIGSPLNRFFTEKGASWDKRANLIKQKLNEPRKVGF